MANEKKNVKLIQNLYDAFGRGDMETIANALEDEVDWQVVGPPVVGYTGRWQGRSQVRAFFQALAQTVTHQKFEPREFIAGDDHVVVLGSELATVNETRRPYEAEWVHIFTIKDGKIAAFKEFTDTTAMLTAFPASA